MCESVVCEYDGTVVEAVAQAPPHSLVESAESLLGVPLVARQQAAGLPLVVVLPLELHLLVLEVGIRYAHHHDGARVGVCKVESLAHFAAAHSQKHRASRRAPGRRRRVRVRRRSNALRDCTVVLHKQLVERTGLSDLT